MFFEQRAAKLGNHMFLDLSTDRSRRWIRGCKLKEKGLHRLKPVPRHRALITASPATAAVSDLRTVLPSEAWTQPAAIAFARSSGAHPPSGPNSSATVSLADLRSG